MYRSVCFLLLLANQSVADAASIESLSEDVADPEPDTTNGWVLYPPLPSARQWMQVERCTLSLLAADESNTLIATRTIDLAAARIRPDPQTGALYTWSQDYFGLSTPGASHGLIGFEALRDGAILLSREDDPETTAELLPHTVYVLAHDPQEQTLADLAFAISAYQQDNCLPLG